MFRGSLTLTLMLLIIISFPIDSALAGDKDGYIYGKVITRTGNTYTGLIRWGTEEAFWDDLFNSSKEDLPFRKYVDKAEHDAEYQHMMEASKEAEIQAKEIEEETFALQEEVELLKEKVDAGLMKETDDEIRELKREIRELQRQSDESKRMASRIERDAKKHYEQARKMAKKRISVLGGAITVNVDDWDGYSARQFIARFGDIKKIEVIGSEDAEITMKNGSIFIVSGYANDVGGEINVRDASLGEIELPWKKIEYVEFMSTPNNVQPEGYRIKGKLMSDAGAFDGFIQWDSEECISTDKIDGDSEDGKVSLSMGTIRNIERRSRSSCLITLKDGRKLVLDGTNDVDESIRGIYVEDARYGRVKVSWDSFESVEFYDKSDSGPGYNSYPKPAVIKGTVTSIDGEEFKGRVVFDIDEAESWEMLNGDRFDVEFIVPFDRISSITPRSRSASMIVLRNGEKLRLDGSKDVSDSNDGVLIFQGDGDENVAYLDWDEIDTIELEW